MDRDSPTVSQASSDKNPNCALENQAALHEFLLKKSTLVFDTCQLSLSLTPVKDGHAFFRIY
jgi:hypothetical protein